MGGRISVRSEGVNGKGCVFSFSIVLEAEISEFSLSTDTFKVLKKSKILAVDDRPEIRLQLTEMLLKWGCIPFVVPGAEEGLKYIKCGMEFDTIIVDMCMPYMSGTELAQELRRTVPDVPLIGISSIEINSGEKYFDIFLYKPITQNTLFPALLKCLNKRKRSDLKKSQSIKRSDASGESHRHLKRSNTSKREKHTEKSKIERKESNLTVETQHRRKHPKELKILVAEDEKNNAFTLMEMLSNMGFPNCERVENGKLCIEKVKSELWDVVLMDIRMPIMDGIEATRHIRSSKNPPYIIAISAGVLNSDKERCQTAGIDAYLPKPITKESLKIALEPLIKTSHRKNIT
jgi:CheY-like chemotaxis protein